MRQSSVTAFRAPLYIAWELTHLCNAECVHCYSLSGPHASTSSDLTTSEALTVIDQLATAGLLVLAFSGGEPLLRKDWREIVTYAVHAGLSVNVGTNGSTITRAVADELAGIGLSSVTVSLDSHLPERHDAFRRRRGLFLKAVNAVRLLRERSVRVVVGFTPTVLNWRDGPQVVELAASLGANATNLSEYVPAGRGTIQLALSPSQLREVLQDWIRLREEYRGRMEIIWHDCRVGMLVPESEKRDYVGCGAGRLVARILPDGTVTPCVFLPTPIGSLRANSFEQLWSVSPLLERFRTRADFAGNCGSCEYLDSCGGCRAVAFAYSGGDPCAGDPHCWVNRDNPRALRVLTTGEGLPV